MQLIQQHPTKFVPHISLVKPDSKEFKIAKQKEIIIKTVLEFEAKTSRTQALAKLNYLFQLGQLDTQVTDAIQNLSRNNKISKQSFYKWFACYNEGGLTALKPHYKGRVASDTEWHHNALDLFLQPSQPSMKSVYYFLVEELGFTCTYAMVKRFLNKAAIIQKDNPVKVRKSKHRLGTKTYQLQQASNYRRDTGILEAGDIWMADGHTLDVYLAHPATGNPWRAELVVWMDVKSRYVVGWHIDTAESAISTAAGFSKAVVNTDHVPPMIYIDNGAGYKSKMMSDSQTGIYSRAGVVDVITALPGNPHGKGHIERFFRSMEDDYNKVVWGQAFVGNNCSQEMKIKTFNLAKKGKVQYPSLDQWIRGFESWLGRYHQRQHNEYPTLTRQQVWLKVQKNQPHILEIYRPQEKRKVIKSEVKLHNRHYRHSDLEYFNTSEVIVEYDLSNDAVVWVFDKSHNLICEAELYASNGFLEASRLEEARRKSKEAAIKRLAQKQEEIRRRESMPITVESIEHKKNKLPNLIELEAETGNAIEIFNFCEDLIED